MTKVLIVFTDAHLAYSPSTLNLYNSLKERCDVQIVAFEPDHSYSSQKVDDSNVIYLENPPIFEDGIPLTKRLYTEIRKSIKPITNADLLTAKARILIEYIKQFDGVLIAIDFFALWCIQQAGKSAHVFSLEIFEKDKYKNACVVTKIESVITQSQDRYDFLFPKHNVPVFYVQNSPYYIAIDESSYEKREKKKLVFCGSAMPFFGIFSCLEFISDHPEYSLTVKGAVPSFVQKVIQEHFAYLITEKRLIIDSAYLGPEALNVFLDHYYIGFVFYDLYRFEFVNSFNYKTVPSGKLSQYYNAGVPVIANNLKGLKSIKDYHAGVLIDNLSSKNILEAINQIESNYTYYAKGAKQASVDFDYKKGITPFIDFLTQKKKPTEP